MYSSLIEQFFESGSARPGRRGCLYVFQGFDTAFLNELNAQLPYLGGFFEGCYSELPINDERAAALNEALGKLKKTAWCVYEDFTALSLAGEALGGYKGRVLIVKNDLFGDAGYALPLDKAVCEQLLSLTSENGGGNDDQLLEYYSGIRMNGEDAFVRYVNRHFKLDTGSDADETGFYAALESDNPEQQPHPEKAKDISFAALDSLAALIQKGEAEKCIYKLHASRRNAEAIRRVRCLDMAAALSGARVILADEKEDALDDDKYLPYLRRFWGENALFRSQKFYCDPENNSETGEVSQGHIISDIIRQCERARGGEDSIYSDIIVTAPTGSGKSLFFQLPGVHLHESAGLVTVVVCPLIALMVDQVRELNERGIEEATYINGAISYEERTERIKGIKDGTYSIVYLSPELLLAMEPEELFGTREIGLTVVDEAHLVTSWGRDFRVDYWFLGDYINKLRQAKRRFPVLCLTATAVYGGSEDIVTDLMESLHLDVHDAELYIGYVRRDDICFSIRRPEKSKEGDKAIKEACAVKQITNAVSKGKKTIMYFPYKSQVDSVRASIIDARNSLSSKVETYTGDMASLDKNESYDRFRTGASPVMLATKAFGMGVNIDDIAAVYHYAPTGSLSDYVQEIGRAARNHDKVPIGLAVTDYLKSDMRYAQTLWGLSGLRHYQLKAMARKLLEMYTRKQTRNLNVSPETFTYLFEETGLDNRVKSGLMLLATDLKERYGYELITVRARSLFSRQFLIVPNSLSRRFMPLYKDYLTLMEDSFTQHELAYGSTAAVDTFKTGDVYEIDLSRLWAERFASVPFAVFKKQFYTGELFASISQGAGGFDVIVPQMRLEINYDREDYAKVCERFDALAVSLQETFTAIRSSFGGRNFTLTDFARAFKERYTYPVRNEYISMCLDLFAYPHVDIGAAPKEQWKFVEKRKDPSSPALVYCLRTQKYGYLAANLQRYFRQLAPNSENKYIAYVAIPKNENKQPYQHLMATLLQIFELASYEYEGGKNTQVFVRLNDPEKLRRMSEREYSYKNSVLIAIEQRHRRAKLIMNRFLGQDLRDAQRWEIIEQYFLGKDEWVDKALGIAEDEKPVMSFDGFTLLDYEQSPDSWQDVPGCAELEESGIVLPELSGGRITVGDSEYPLCGVWLKKKLMYVNACLPEAEAALILAAGFTLPDVPIRDCEKLKA